MSACRRRWQGSWYPWYSDGTRNPLFPWIAATFLDPSDAEFFEKGKQLNVVLAILATAAVSVFFACRVGPLAAFNADRALLTGGPAADIHLLRCRADLSRALFVCLRLRDAPPERESAAPLFAPRHNYGPGLAGKVLDNAISGVVCWLQHRSLAPQSQFWRQASLASSSSELASSVAW